MSLGLRWGVKEPTEPVFRTGARSAGLEEFVMRLRQRTRPHLYDVGPAPGKNIVTFAGFGFVVHVDAEKDHRLSGVPPESLDFEDGFLDGALLWDLVDFLPQGRVEPFVQDLTRAMKPGGLVFLLSSASRQNGPGPVFTYLVEDGMQIGGKHVEGTLAARIPRENRDIFRIFDRFENVSLHLLRSGMRELLLKRR